MGLLLPLASGDVTNVALDHLLVIHQIDVADELHLDPAAIARLQRQVFGTRLGLSAITETSRSLRGERSYSGFGVSIR